MTTQVLDETGVVLHTKSYDAFGKPRNGDWSDMGTLFEAKLAFDTPLLDANGNIQFHANGDIISDETGIDLSKRGFTDHEHLDEMQLIHMNGRMYDYNNGRFLSVDPFIQAPTSTQSMNPYTYIFNNPLSGVDPTGYTGEVEKDTDDGDVGKQDSGITVTGSRLTQTNNGVKNAYANIGVRATAVNSQGKDISDTGWQARQNNAGTNATGGDNSGIGDQGSVNKSDSTTGGVNGFYTSDKDILIDDPDLHGEVVELLDGRVQLAKWGSKDEVLSEEEISVIRSSLITLESSSGLKLDSGYQIEGGKQLLNRLSKDNPLKILLNNGGENAAINKGLLITIDLATTLYFKDYNKGGKWVEASLIRKIAHESGHAIRGNRDKGIGGKSVKRTDMIMFPINRTRRLYYNNWSTWCLSCE